jgi:hypothetical protein
VFLKRFPIAKHPYSAGIAITAAMVSTMLWSPDAPHRRFRSPAQEPTSKMIPTSLQVIFEACNSESGLSADEYTDKMAEAIAKQVTEHIIENAKVSITTFSISAGPYPVTGSATEKVS